MNQNSQHQHARVLYNFSARSPHELTIKEGERVRVLQRSENGWWVGDLNGEMGVFPGSYVKLEESLQEVVASVRGGRESKQPSYVRATRDYAAVHGAQLSFKKGDVFMVVERYPTNWWKGDIAGTQGLFPKSHVEEISPDEAESVLGLTASKADSSASRPKTASPAQRPTTAKALYDYEGITVSACFSSPSLVLCIPGPSSLFLVTLIFLQHLTEKQDSELSFKAGDVINVHAKLEKGWWKGEINGKVCKEAIG